MPALGAPLGMPLGGSPGFAIPEVGLPSPVFVTSDPSVTFGPADDPTDFGSDYQTFPDFTGGMPLQKGARVLAEALLRRLSTDPGQLPFHPEYGFNVLDALHAEMADADMHSLAAGIENQCELDERVQSCSALVTYDSTAFSLAIVLSVLTAQGPFRFTFLVTDTAFSILEVA